MGEWKKVPGWPLDVPPPARPGDTLFARRVGNWTALRLPPGLLTAVPDLAEWPRATGRMAWSWARYLPSLRGLGATEAHGADLPHAHTFAAVLPEDVAAAVLRARLDPVADTATAAELAERLEALEALGPYLPEHITRRAGRYG